jgi:hypothetical protein
VSLGERQAGAGSVAAAVRFSTGQVFGSLSLCGPQDRFTPAACEAYGALVAAAGAEISAEIGFRAEADPVGTAGPARAAGAAGARPVAQRGRSDADGPPVAMRVGG